MDSNTHDVENEWPRTRIRGTLEQEYSSYFKCANDGKGGDITRNGAPLLTFTEWLGVG